MHHHGFRGNPSTLHDHSHIQPGTLSKARWTAESISTNWASVMSVFAGISRIKVDEAGLWLEKRNDLLPA